MTDDPNAFRRAVQSGYDGLADAYAAQRDDGDDSPDLLAELFDSLPADARASSTPGAGPATSSSKR